MERVCHNRLLRNSLPGSSVTQWIQQFRTLSPARPSMFDNDVGLRYLHLAGKDIPSIESMVPDCIHDGVQLGLLQVRKPRSIVVVFQYQNERLKFETQRYHSVL